MLSRGSIRVLAVRALLGAAALWPMAAFAHAAAAGGMAPVGMAPVGMAPVGMAPVGMATGGVALVFGNAGYTGLPPLPACLTSAHAVAATLRRLNFVVVEREDATGGEMDGALSAFTAEVHRRGHPATVIYACGYGAGFNQRSFLLPISAAISRPADILTEGVLTRSILATIDQSEGGPSVAVLDVAAMPHGEQDLGLGSLIQADLPSQLGLVAVVETPSGVTPTPIANALIAALQAPLPVAVQAVLLAETNAAKDGVHVAALHAPAAPEVLIAAPEATMPARPHAPPIRPAEKSPPATAAQTSSAEARTVSRQEAPSAPGQSQTPLGMPAAGPGGARPPLPAEGHMTASDRREVQSALARLGYYDGRIDGIFGPDTRAAIRRWQFEVHAPMTGQLTAAEANRLAGH